MNDDIKPRLPSHIAYSAEDGSGDKKHWHRIGAAWPSKSGGLSLKLSSLPVDGYVHLQLRSEVDKLRAQRQEDQPQVDGPQKDELKP